MLSISKHAVEKLKETPEDTKKGFRVFISGLGWGGPRLGLALDERKKGDEQIVAEGFSFIMDSEVAEIIRSYGPLFVDYKNSFFTKGFQLTLQGAGAC